MGNIAMLTSLSLFLCIFSINLVPSAVAVWITLPASGTKCVSEEIQNNVVVLADYVVVPDDPSHVPTIAVKVTSPYGNNLHHSENTTHGHFAFTTQETGNYLACFWVDGHNKHGGGDVSVNLDWKIGIAAKDWDTVARKEKIEGVELELRKLEGAVEAIHENLLYLKGREAEMRIVSEKTNGRVAWFSVMSLGVCIAASALQLWHLKRFFQKKKLI
ncbi:transmembrane emp24 domain-containing protein p24delta4-like [Gastrolobium bilobum]|uniref:transmembrane emp24 domain-containing protein p24delta4-like n=1 Tax=Gastrolobium bilobum TaxID=150636 RepID=UPI002AAFC673|nr:transmembrane emp24 domain-containing protein p24delta4-like [Gastrolobium bilobum]